MKILIVSLWAFFQRFSRFIDVAVTTMTVSRTIVWNNLMYNNNQSACNEDTESKNEKGGHNCDN